MEAYETLKRLLTEVDADMAKAQGGNKAAQTRVRKAMQEIKSAAQAVRVGMLAPREGGGAASEGTGVGPVRAAAGGKAPGAAPGPGKDR